MTELKRSLPADFIIYSGDDALALPMMALGAHGVVSVAAHLVGPALQDMVQAAAAGDMSRARDLHLRLYPIFTGLFFTTSPIPVKSALNLLGQEAGGLRLPLAELNAAEEAQLIQLLRDNGLME